jgi:hypothetical protein
VFADGIGGGVANEKKSGHVGIGGWMRLKVKWVQNVKALQPQRGAMLVATQIG